MGRVRKDVHQVQPKALSITNATEYGLAYSRDGGRGTRRGREAPWPCVPLGRCAVCQCGRQYRSEPADLTWRAGVDAMSFGFVKNGGLNAEALILFRTELADEVAVRRKRAGSPLVQGTDARCANPRLARRRPLARQCASSQCRGPDASPGRRRSAPLSCRGQ